MVPAIFFDGQSARKRPVQLSLRAGDIHVQGEGISHSEPFNAGMLSEKLGNVPRQLHLSTGGYCLIQDNTAFEAMLHEANIKSRSVVSHFESRWHFALIALAFTSLVAISVYIWGLPVLADALSKRIPPSIPARMDKETLALLDRGALTPTTLSIERQNTVIERFKQLQVLQGQIKPAYNLVFRNSEVIGPNAFALPGGTILITDQLIKLADQDPKEPDQVIAVLSHELGHISHRHALRQIVQSSIVAFAMTWYLGDISSLLAAVPTAILQTKYSREFESEADDYAILMLEKNGLSSNLLADALMKLERFYKLKSPTDESSQDSLGEYFSTHPLTQNRINKLRAKHHEK